MDPAKVGRDLGEILGTDESLGTPVTASLRDVLDSQSVDVVLQATGSHIPDVADQLKEIAAAGCNVVSTCEELAYPWLRHPALAREIDAKARECGVTILGTGVNPGFIMDTLVLVATAVCSDVRRIASTRWWRRASGAWRCSKRSVPAWKRRTFANWRPGARLGTWACGNLSQLITAGLGWEIRNPQENIEPVCAERDLDRTLRHCRRASGRNPPDRPGIERGARTGLGSYHEHGRRREQG